LLGDAGAGEGAGQRHRHAEYFDSFDLEVPRHACLPDGQLRSPVSSDMLFTDSSSCTTFRLASIRSGGSFESGTSLRYFASTSAHSIPRGPDPRGKSTWFENFRPSFSVMVTVAP